MSAPLKLAAFGIALVVVLGGAFGLGRLSGVDEAATTEPAHHGESDDGHGDHATSPAAKSVPGGLQVAEEGYAIELLGHATEPGREEPLEFRIVGPDGSPVTDFVETHEADLHLIVVRRDLTGYRHVHPELGADGTWSVPLEFGEAGVYRAFADFTPGGRADALTLGIDVDVSGVFTAELLAAPEEIAEVGPYTVTLDGTLVAGEASTLTLSVSRDGVPVTDLQPYLGANGHLVVLRDGDLAYLHVHPDDAADADRGPDVGFVVEAPSDGTYRLFFEFQHQDTVRTVEFTITSGHDH